nr:MAG TPA: RNAse domain protein [Caudoviricetes sp.]
MRMRIILNQVGSSLSVFYVCANCTKIGYFDDEILLIFTH